MKYVLDTNVFREIGKITPHLHVARWLATVDDAELAISALTIREVVKGISRLRTAKPDVAAAIEARVSMALAAFDNRILAVDGAVAKVWGEMLAEAEKHLDDAGLAATARVYGLILVTRNARHFVGRRISQLDPYGWPVRRA